MLGDGPDWVGGLTGVRVHCKWRASNTPSQMWGSWHLPRFLFNGWLLTLIHMASFMVLVMLCDSVSTIEKLSNLMMCPVVWEWQNIGEGALRYSFNLSPKFPPVSPIYSMVHPGWSHLYL